MRNDVLPPGQLRVKSGADLEEGCHPPGDLDASGGGLCDSTEDLQEGRLAGAVATDDPNPVAGLDLEVEILESPELLELGVLGVWRQGMAQALVKPTCRSGQGVAQGLIAVCTARVEVVADDVLLAEVLDLDDAHMTSANSRSIRRKNQNPTAKSRPARPTESKKPGQYMGVLPMIAQRNPSITPTRGFIE